MRITGRLGGFLLAACVLGGCRDDGTGSRANARGNVGEERAKSLEASEESVEANGRAKRARSVEATELLRHEAGLEATFVAAISELRGRADAASQVRLALLLATADPRSLGGAPSPAADRDRSRAIVAAGLADPDDALAAWLEALDCPDVAICDPAAARARLQRIDPENAAAWLLELDALGNESNPSRIDAALARAAQASGHDVALQDAITSVHAMMKTIVPAMSPAQQRAMGRHVGLPGPVDDEMFASVMTMTVASPIPLPSYGPVYSACRPGPTLSSARRSSCIRVLDGMAGSGTLLSAMSADSRLLQLIGAGPEQLRVRERLR